MQHWKSDFASKISNEKYTGELGKILRPQDCHFMRKDNHFETAIDKRATYEWEAGTFGNAQVLDANILDVFDLVHVWIKDTWLPSRCVKIKDKWSLYMNDGRFFYDVGGNYANKRNPFRLNMAVYTTGSERPTSVETTETEPNVINLEEMEQMIESSVNSFRSNLAEQLLTNQYCSFAKDPLDVALQLSKKKKSNWNLPFSSRQHTGKAKDEEVGALCYKIPRGLKHLTKVQKLGVGINMVRNDNGIEKAHFFCGANKAKSTGLYVNCKLLDDVKSLRIGAKMLTVKVPHCSYAKVFDIQPTIQCNEPGTGPMLKLNEKNHLIEYCAGDGPFIHQYRIEVLLLDDSSLPLPDKEEYFSSGEYLRPQMQDQGYQLANFYSFGKKDKTKVLRQRVWIQP